MPIIFFFFLLAEIVSSLFASTRKHQRNKNALHTYFYTDRTNENSKGGYKKGTSSPPNCNLFTLNFLFMRGNSNEIGPLTIQRIWSSYTTMKILQLQNKTTAKGKGFHASAGRIHRKTLT